MKSRLLKTCSWILVLALLVNLLPVQGFALETQETTIEDTADYTTNSTDSAVTTNDMSLEDTTILMEIEENRTEFTKEYKLSNGMLMAIVYPEAVHYEENGQWKDIDNTLKVKGSGKSATYTTTAGSWHAEFPQQLREGAKVTITKDGYAVSFGMAGELRSHISSSGAATTYNTRSIQGTTQTMTISGAKESNGQVHTFDYSKEKENVQHPEVIRDKLKSRMSYTGVYSNTDIIYDVNSYQLKESIVINSYDAAVRGYLYTLDTGTLVPVLNDDGSIDLLKPNSTEIIMTMPAPYMIDNAGAVSYEVAVTLEQDTDEYILTYQLPVEWLAAEDRVWPVVLDPAVLANSSHANLLDQTVTTGSSVAYTAGCVMCGYDANSYGKMRTFVEYREIPEITSADVIVYAKLELLAYEGTSGEVLIEAHKVLDTWISSTITWENQPDYNQTIEDYAYVSGTGRYLWDITEAVQEWYSKENTGIMLKVPDSIENSGVTSWKKFYSIDYDVTNDDIWPYLTIFYRNTNGLESYWDYTSTSAGRAGTGYVNNYTGNLTWVHNDIGFGGNRMPVSISHIYNSNDSIKNDFGLGYGWRTNYHQTLLPVEAGDDVLSINAAYVWEDGDGTKHYFEDPDKDGKYTDEDGLELTLTVSGDTLTITDKYGNTSNFDSHGRLVNMVNNQATTSKIEISYTNDEDKLISQISDGAGRKYNFTYTNNLLTRIRYTSTGASDIAHVTFGYSGSQLTSITSQDGESCAYAYSNGFLTNAVDIDGYRIQYTYSSTVPKRVVAIAEYDVGTLGSRLTIEYGHNQTIFTDQNNHTQITQFNDWGNVVSVQDSEGHAQFTQYDLNEHDAQSGKSNQLNLTSKMQNTVVNLLLNSSFEEGVSWTAVSANASFAASSAQAYLGSKSLAITSSASGTAISAYGAGITLPVGESCTFSAYVLPSSTSVCLGLGTTTTTLAVSDTLDYGSDWTRLEVSYTNNGQSSVTVRPQLITGSAGTIYIDCVQAEYEPTASRYNIIENGDFRNGITGWIRSSECDSNDICVTAGSSAAPQMNSTAFRIVGDPGNKCYLQQQVPVSGQKDDTYVLAGWAMGKGVPLIVKGGDIRTFTIRGTFLYTDGTTGNFDFTFNPDTDGNTWQYCCGVMVAKQAYSGIKIQLLYDYGANNVYFDGIQLFKEEFGSSYTYDSNGNVISVVGLQKQETTYEYDENSNLSKIIQDGTTKMTYTYDDHHNVITATPATTETGVVYEFTYDNWGNNTSVSITNGTTTITSSARYTADGNYLVSTTDALGNITTYGYDTDTGILKWVQYPKDTASTRTEYTYDSMYRLATASVDTNTGNTLNASYTYSDDLLTSITTGSTMYNFAYGDFAQISSIKVGNQTLASYTYTTDQNHYLSKLDYGNGDSVQYSYDNYGRLVQETFEDGDTVSYKYDNTGALATVTDSATGIKTTYYYDLTDRLMKYVETDGTASHSVAYTYDTLNNLKRFTETIGEDKLITHYTYDADNRVSTITHTNISGQYTYDNLGRVSTFLSKYIGDTIVTDTYTYYSNSGQVNKLEMTAANYSSSYTYTYDDNGNILSVSDGTHTTSYVYDSANQLVRENNQAAGKTWTWTYDDAGNILSRKEYAYTTGTLGTVLDTVSYSYSTGAWGDLLTKFDGLNVSSDAIGNTTQFGGTTYSWEHGRELESLSLPTDFAIVGQPADAVGIVGDAISFTVDARGSSLTYQWQVSNNGGTSWSDSTGLGYATDTLYGFNITEARNGNLYRCVVTDSNGNVRISEAGEIVLVPIVIDSQPQDFFGAIGDSVTFSCEARGTSLSYQWQVSTNGGTSWSNSTGLGYATNTLYGFEVTSARVGNLYRCRITDGNGNVSYTAAAEICLNNAKIISDPENYKGILGDTAIFHVEAGGNGLSYQWQYNVNGTWYDSTATGNKTATMQLEITEARLAFSYRCAVTDSNGNTVYSEPACMEAATDTWTYTYNADGLRTSRTDGYTTYEYIYHGSRLTQMTVGDDRLRFGYDANGTPLYVIWNQSKYFYVTNLQGDVVAIVSESGYAVVCYTYDAWGNILSITGIRADNLGILNPLRYRGYVYDHETELYYLQSRYYDPEWGRFLNADVFVSTGQGILGNNMFAYCNNTPVMCVDSLGLFAESANYHSCLDDDSLSFGGVLALYEATVADFVKNGIQLYTTINSALSAWANIYLPLSAECEYVAFLYRIETPLGSRYFMSQTFKGSKGGSVMSPNVIYGTLLLSFQDQFTKGELVAQVHTHPNPGVGYHNDYPSYSNNIYGGDRIAFELLGFPEMYIIPYAACAGTPGIIVYSDRSTWCSNCPY